MASYTQPDPTSITTIERKVHTAITAINTRTFCLPHWSTIADAATYTADTQALLHPDHPNTAAVPLATWLEALKTLTKEWPEYHIDIVDINTSMKDRNHAICYFNGEFSGAFPGVSRSMMLVWRFRVVEGEWRAVRMDLLGGIMVEGVGGDEGEKA